MFSQRHVDVDIRDPNSQRFVFGDAPASVPRPLQESEDRSGGYFEIQERPDHHTFTPSAKPTSPPNMVSVARPPNRPAPPIESPSWVPTESPSVPPTFFNETSIAPSMVPSMFNNISSEMPSMTPTTVLDLTSEAPSAVPTSDVDIPPGPYVTVQTSSERVLIPIPPIPDMISTPQERTHCPHEESDLRDYHDPSLWGGSLPAKGEDFSIPENTRVVITRTLTRQLGIVSIPETSELIFAENADGIRLDLVGMQVYGKLTIGSETCRMETPVTITLHGSRPNDAVTNVPAPQIKGISVSGGTLNLHGKRYFHTWSRLAQTVEAGSTTILLQTSVNWEPGQQVILVTTAMKDSKEWHQNEVLTIEEVYNNPHSDVGAAVLTREPTKHRHVANFNYQGEVGLLTRTIKIQGAEDDSEPTDPDPLNCQLKRPGSAWGNRQQPCVGKDLAGYGGHIMVHSGGRGFVEGVELYRMGQTNLLGRYPIHFHLLGNCPSCYFKDSSVHRSYYRCVSIHGTNQLTVQENVAYDVTGFCYYLEDGVEEENTLAYNLVAHVHLMGEPPWGSGQRIDVIQQSEDMILPADSTASGFYITNVHNYIYGNAASGVSLIPINSNQLVTVKRKKSLTEHLLHFSLYLYRDGQVLLFQTYLRHCKPSVTTSFVPQR